MESLERTGKAREPGGGVTLGVDTHEDEHVVVALDALGRRVRSASFPATKAGYRRLLRWGEALGASLLTNRGLSRSLGDEGRVRPRKA